MRFNTLTLNPWSSSIDSWCTWVAIAFFLRSSAFVFMWSLAIQLLYTAFFLCFLLGKRAKKNKEYGQFDEQKLTEKEAKKKEIYSKMPLKSILFLRLYTTAKTARVDHRARALTASGWLQRKKIFQRGFYTCVSMIFAMRFTFKCANSRDVGCKNEDQLEIFLLYGTLNDSTFFGTHQSTPVFFSIWVDLIILSTYDSTAIHTQWILPTHKETHNLDLIHLNCLF